MPDNVQGKMMRGAVWMLLLKSIDQSLGFISTLVLVRLLSPTDFGILAIGLSFVAMAELLIAFGFDIALIQHPNPDEDHYHSAWTCNVILGSTITVILLAAAWPIAGFYHQAEVFWVLCALAFGPFFASLENVGIVRFRKDLQFRKEFTFRTSRRLITFLVTLPLAFWWRSYWALVAGILMTKLGGSLLSYVAHEFRPRFRMNKAKELFGFSKWLLINNIVCFFKDRSTDFVIGRWKGPRHLGLYNISSEIANMPTTDLSASINRALLPGFAKIETENELKKIYGNAMGILAMIALPAAAGIFSVAPFLVPVILGVKWIESTPLLEILSFNGAVILFHSSIGAVLIARGFPSDMTKTNVLYVLLLFTMLAAIVPTHGAVGAAYAVLGTAIIMTPVFLNLIKRRIGIGNMVFVRAIVRPGLASLLMALSVRWALPVYDRSMETGHAAVLLAGGVVLGITVYVGSIGLLWVLAGRPEGAERHVFERVRDTILKFFSSH
ncbi:MAG: lipopolysaccharide biosynthesis protein [Sulfuricaulis sp.]